MAEDKIVSDVGTAQDREGPVLKAHMNRIRAIKKKLRKIEAIQSLVADGKEINSDQRSTLSAKDGCEAVAEELERMLALINAAVKEEHGLARTAAMEEMKTTIEAEVAGTVELLRAEAASKDTLIGNLREGMEQQQERIKELEEQVTLNRAQQEESASKQEGIESAMGDVLALIYFGQLFNQAKSWPAELERQSCISYDGILSPDQAQGEALQAKDLDAMVVLSNLLMSRKVGEVQSHQNAINECKDLAMAWINDSELFIPEVSTQVSKVKQQLGRILASEYCSILPKVAGAEEVAAGMNTYLPQLSSMTSPQAMQQPVSEPPPPIRQVAESEVAVVQQQHQQMYQPQSISQDVVEAPAPGPTTNVTEVGDFGGNRQSGGGYQGGMQAGVYPQVQNGIQIGDFTQPPPATQQQFAPIPEPEQQQQQQQQQQVPQQTAPPLFVMQNSLEELGVRMLISVA
eukprot:TRINITY_DN7394_c0_g1_i2.p1 TRINITY_DN7394_c0_g1~~TRINITY_DN7394_c0_g1_i2.p1  ORF type:complete len:459 (+),score=94.38 TRINITY_DN7394_c0_g1_i2:45-1421(+)